MASNEGGNTKLLQWLSLTKKIYKIKVASQK